MITNLVISTDSYQVNREPQTDAVKLIYTRKAAARLLKERSFGD